MNALNRDWKAMALSLFGVFAIGAASATAIPIAPTDWTQTGKDSMHSSFQNVAGLGTSAVLGQFTLDPNAAAELKDQGDILAHYQSVLTQGNDVYSELKGGSYSPADHSGFIDWSTQTWSEQKLSWVNGVLTPQWVYKSAWKPVPHTSDPRVTYGPGIGPSWEPVFGAAITSAGLWVPEAGGTVALVNASSGALIKQYNPFGKTIDASGTYAVSPITADAAGNIYYTAVKFNVPAVTKTQNDLAAAAWGNDILGSWLVQVDAKGVIHLADFATITKGAIAATADCEYSFSAAQLPFPPSPTATPATNKCGSQRAAVNAMPAVDNNGKVYVVSRAHFNSRYGYLIQLNTNLALSWIASLRDRLNDGCNVLVPATGTVGGCKAGAKDGVDPNTNNLPAGRVLDDSSASPTVAPDGSVYFGVYTRYNFAEGHMMHFGSNGNFLNSYLFGWDATPGTFGGVANYTTQFKENHYGDVGSYCNDPTLCPATRTATYPNDPGEFFLSRFDSNLNKVVGYQNKNTLSCSYNNQGILQCTSDHPDGFEWCVNSVVTDANGVTYGASEDGNIYAMNPDGSLKSSHFLSLSLGAAYTPTSMDGVGRLYAQNFGQVFVLGK